MNINLAAVFVAALIPMAMGFIWYNPKLLGPAWQRSAGVSDEQIKSANLALIFGVSFIFSLMLSFEMNIIAYHDAFVGGALYYVNHGAMAPEPGTEAAKWLEYFQTNLSDTCRNFKHGAFHGAFIAGLFISVPVIGTNALFERKGFKYIAINAGYWIITLALMGGTVAAWK